MSDAMSGLGQGGMNYLSDVQANRNARAENATNDKWAPLLALNKSKGAANVAVPSASFAKTLGPLLAPSMDSSPTGSSTGSGSSGGGGAAAGIDPTADATSAGASGAGAAMGPAFAGGGKLQKMTGPTPWIKMKSLEIHKPHSGAQPPPAPMGNGLPEAPPSPMGGAPMMANGGSLQKYDNGGGMSSIMSLLPMLAMLASKGGQVPGQAQVAGDSTQNDTQLVAGSPGEVMLPRTVAKAGMDGNKWKVAAYLNEVKHHGPGPMPPSAVKNLPNGPQNGKANSSSLSPWKALACGGKVGR